MKNLFVFGLILVLFSCSSDDNQPQSNPTPPARTTISDSNFEQALIDLGIDDTLDGSVLKSSVINVTELVLNNKNISSFDGIQDFEKLYNFWANDNSLSTLNLSANTKLKFIYVDNNNISSINVQNFPELEKLSFINNNISNVDISNNSALQQLIINGNNFSQLDVSSNPDLNILDTRNNNIGCIKVSDDQFANIPNTWDKDNSTIYSTTCN